MAPIHNNKVFNTNLATKNSKNCAVTILKGEKNLHILLEKYAMINFQKGKR